VAFNDPNVASNADMEVSAEGYELRNRCKVARVTGSYNNI